MYSVHDLFKKSIKCYAKSHLLKLMRYIWDKNFQSISYKNGVKDLMGLLDNLHRVLSINILI